MSDDLVAGYDAVMAESRTDEKMADAARSAGRQVTARTLRLWRQWNILPPTEVYRGGRGRTESTYPSGTVDLVNAMVDAFKVTGVRDRAVLVAWWRGAEVGDEALRRAFRTTYLEVSGQLARLQRGQHRWDDRWDTAPDGVDAATAMEAVTAIVTGSSTAATEHYVSKAAAAMDQQVSRSLPALCALMGAPDDSPPEGPADIDAASLSLVTRGSRDRRPQTLPRVHRVVESLTLDVARVSAIRADRADLDQARNFLRTLSEGTDNVFPDRRNPNELELAMMVPMFYGIFQTFRRPVFPRDRGRSTS